MAESHDYAIPLESVTRDRVSADDKDRLVYYVLSHLLGIGNIHPLRGLMAELSLPKTVVERLIEALPSLQLRAEVSLSLSEGEVFVQLRHVTCGSLTFEVPVPRYVLMKYAVSMWPKLL
jgi:hypothetical protein